MLLRATLFAFLMITSAASFAASCGRVNSMVDTMMEKRSITNCSFKNGHILIKTNQPLQPGQMRLFVFIGFTAAGWWMREGGLRSTVKAVYVGAGDKCQMLDGAETAELQRSAKYDGDSALRNAMKMANDARQVACPK